MKIVGINGAVLYGNGGSLAELGVAAGSNVLSNPIVQDARRRMTPAEFGQWLEVFCRYFPNVCQAQNQPTPPPTTPATTTPTAKPWYEDTTTLLVLVLAGLVIFYAAK